MRIAMMSLMRFHGSVRKPTPQFLIFAGEIRKVTFRIEIGEGQTVEVEAKNSAPSFKRR